MRVLKTINYLTLKENFDYIKNKFCKNKKIMCVVKANAYGFNDVLCSLKSFKESDYLCVATILEALRLRENGVKNKILVLGKTPKTAFIKGIKNDISLSVDSKEEIIYLSAVSKILCKIGKFHLAINSGMNRLGLTYESELNEFINVFLNLPSVEFEGVFTHFCGDRDDEKFYLEQIKKFDYLVKRINAYGYYPLTHTQATEFLNIETDYDAVRVGLALYGFGNLGTKNCLNIKAKIVDIHLLKKGDSVGYNRTFIADKNYKIATVSMGYGDGLVKSYGKNGYFLFGDKKLKILGKICMDMTVIDISSIPYLKIGDYVDLLNDNFTAEDFAKISENCVYETLCNFDRIVR